MSASGKDSESKGKKERENAVIEIKISIPSDFGGNFSDFISHMGKAAREVARAGLSFIETEEKSSPKMKKIEIK